VGVLVPGANATLQSLSNAAKIRVIGFEAEARLKPTDNLTLELKMGLLDAEFKRFQLDAGDPITNLRSQPCGVRA
jgi:outer membrane receptor protein involved in Fe transport